MNEQNLDYLKENLKYLGFGDKLHEDLERGLKSGAAEFQLTQNSQVSKKPFEVTLNFRKSESTDRYFFNSYHASLKYANGETKDQVFYLTNGKGVTAKEAYNLLEGRAVYKELTNKGGETYKAWIQLDFDKKDKHNNHEVKQYHEAYGYDLKASLSRYSVSDLDGGEREKALLHSLQKGNLQSIALATEVGVTKVFVEANPQYKSVRFYDSELKRVPKERLEQYLKPEGAKEKSAKQEQKQDVTEGVKQNASRRQSRSRSAGM